MRNIKRYGAFILMVMLAACVVPKPTSFDQSLAIAYATQTAVLNAAANAVTVGTLSPSDGEQVLKMSDQSKVLLDTAKATAVTGDIKTAEAQLQLALNILTELQTYVNKRAVK